MLLLLVVAGLLLYTIYNRYEDNRQQPEIDTVERVHYEAFNIELPEEFYFCSEPVPLNEPDVRERLDQQLHKNVFFHSSTFLIMKRANRWLPQITAVMEQYGVPDDLKYLAIIESALTNVVSPAGATGFWQIMPTTGREFGLQINNEVDERYDPIKATHVACRYFLQAYKKFGNWTLAAASYNRGMAGVERALTRQRVQSFYDLKLNSETAHYVFRAMAIKEIVENPQKYRYELSSRHLYHPEETRTVEVSSSVPDLVEFAIQQGINYKILKMYNPWLRSDRLTVRNGQIWQIKVPARVTEEMLTTDDGLQPIPETDSLSADTTRTKEAGPELVL